LGLRAVSRSADRFGPWITVYKRHRRWSADGTWQLLLTAIQAERDAASFLGTVTLAAW
jgi:transposase